MLLPARMSVLNYLSAVKDADINEIMEAMGPQYKSEKQFTRQTYLDHAMSLEANGMCSLISYELDADGDLSLRFRITDEGKSAVEKYVPEKYRR